MTLTDLTQRSIARVLSVALQVAGPKRPQQLAPTTVDTPLLIAPDGSSATLAHMLDAFCHRVLPGVCFEKAERYTVTLAVEGGLYRLDQAVFPGPYEIFGVVFLFEGDGGQNLAPQGSSTQRPPAETQTSKLELSSEDGLVVTFEDASHASLGGH